MTSLIPLCTTHVFKSFQRLGRDEDLFYLQIVNDFLLFQLSKHDRNLLDINFECECLSLDFLITL